MNRIKELRKELGYKQGKLAEMLFVAQNTLSYWERGKFEPGTEILTQLSKIFNASVDYILGISDVRDPYRLHDISVQIYNKLVELNDGNELNEKQINALFVYFNNLPDDIRVLVDEGK